MWRRVSCSATNHSSSCRGRTYRSAPPPTASRGRPVCLPQLGVCPGKDGGGHVGPLPLQDSSFRCRPGSIRVSSSVDTQVPVLSMQSLPSRNREENSCGGLFRLEAGRATALIRAGVEDQELRRNVALMVNASVLRTGSTGRRIPLSRWRWPPDPPELCLTRRHRYPHGETLVPSPSKVPWQNH